MAFFFFFKSVQQSTEKTSPEINVMLTSVSDQTTEAYLFKFPFVIGSCVGHSSFLSVVTVARFR